MTQQQIKVGDTVQFTVIKKRGRTYTWTLKIGIVEEINGDEAIIKAGRMRYSNTLDRLEVEAQKPIISRFVEAVVKVTQEKRETGAGQ